MKTLQYLLHEKLQHLQLQMLEMNNNESQSKLDIV